MASRQAERAEIRELRDKRWSADEARRVLAAWRASGLSGAAFCREHGLLAQRLHWWSKQLGQWEEPSAPAAVGSIVPAVIRVRGAGGDAAVVARMPSGVVIEARPDGVAAEWLGSLIRTLVER